MSKGKFNNNHIESIIKEFEEIEKFYAHENNSYAFDEQSPIIEQSNELFKIISYEDFIEQLHHRDFFQRISLAYIFIQSKYDLSTEEFTLIFLFRILNKLNKKYGSSKVIDLKEHMEDKYPRNSMFQNLKLFRVKGRSHYYTNVIDKLIKLNVIYDTFGNYGKNDTGVYLKSYFEYSASLLNSLPLENSLSIGKEDQINLVCYLIAFKKLKKYISDYTEIKRIYHHYKELEKIKCLISELKDPQKIKLLNKCKEEILKEEQQRKNKEKNIEVCNSDYYFMILERPKHALREYGNLAKKQWRNLE